MSTATGELQTQVSLGRVCRLRVRIKGGTQIRWRGDAASGAAQPVYPQASLPTFLPPTSRSRVWLRWQGLPERVSDASEELRSSNVAVTVDVVSAQIKQGMQVQPLLRLPEPPASSLTRSLPPSLSLDRTSCCARFLQHTSRRPLVSSPWRTSSRTRTQKGAPLPSEVG